MSLDQSLSDEDIFWGPMTLKEVKRRIFGHARKIPFTVSATSQIEEENTSINILQSHSEPNLLTTAKSNTENVTYTDSIEEDDSFIQMENMVEKLCVSPTVANIKQTQELNNTLEVIEYILNNPPTCESKIDTMTDDSLEIPKPVAKVTSEVEKELPQKNIQLEKQNPSVPHNTPMKSENKAIQETVFKTPENTKPKPVFKTPAQSLSTKKILTSSVKKTPSTSKAFQHIVSPVASYIKNTPSVALVKDSHNKRNISCPSLIPKLKSNLPVKLSNKENNIFTPGAYKSAKKIQVIDTEKLRLPHNHGAKILSVPKPIVQTHNHRILHTIKKNSVQQEDSVADLTVHQAEISVYTQKYASKTDK